MQIVGLETKGENYLLEVDNPMVVPVGKKVRILLTADDVIHAWWVPDLAVKRDAIPGFINEVWTRIDRPASIVASARNCAAAVTPSCPSWSWPRTMPAGRRGLRSSGPAGPPRRRWPWPTGASMT
jgi:hypothetical protein